MSSEPQLTKSSPAIVTREDINTSKNADQQEIVEPERVRPVKPARSIASALPKKEKSTVTPPPVPAEVESLPDDDKKSIATRPPEPLVVDERPADLAFLKLDANGQPLADQSANYSTSPWFCVLDLTTTLMWEIKRDDEGLHDRDWTYTWYDTRAGNGGNTGTAGKGFCGGTLAAGCDTEKFAQAVNSAGLCGANDWRLPTQEELQSIAALDRVSPSIDHALFPNTRPSWYWSSSPVATDAQHAWIIGFYHGYDVWGHKSHDFYVRLVRGAATSSLKLSRSAGK